MHKEIDGLLVPPGNAYTLLTDNPIMSELVQFFFFFFFFFFFGVGISFWLGLFPIIAYLYFLTASVIQQYAFTKQKAQINCAVIVQLISAFALHG